MCNKNEAVVKNIDTAILPVYRNGMSCTGKYNVMQLLIHQIFSLACDWSKHIKWLNIPKLKLGNIQEYFPIFKTECIAKTIWKINTIASIWGEMLGYCPWTLSVPHSSQFSLSYTLGKLFASRKRWLCQMEAMFV